MTIARLQNLLVCQLEQWTEYFTTEVVLHQGPLKK